MMQATDEFRQRIRQTDTMQTLVRSLDEEPAALLDSICRRYEATGRPVPDHYLQLTGFFAETMLRVLSKAGLVDCKSGERDALLVYEPTAQGFDLWKRMTSEKGS
jgi:hypothetical protein